MSYSAGGEKIGALCHADSVADEADFTRPE